MSSATSLVRTARRLYTGVIKAGLLCALLAVVLYLVGPPEAAGVARWLAFLLIAAGIVLAGIATSEETSG